MHIYFFTDLITRLVLQDEIKILGNGEWTDTSCPTVYRLDDNNGGFVTYSELRGAVDGKYIFFLSDYFCNPRIFVVRCPEKITYETNWVANISRKSF